MYWEPQWRLAALTDCFRAVVVVVAVVATSNNAVTSSSLLLLAKRSTRRACLLKRPSLFLYFYDLLHLCYYRQHSFLVDRIGPFSWMILSNRRKLLQVEPTHYPATVGVIMSVAKKGILRYVDNNVSSSCWWSRIYYSTYWSFSHEYLNLKYVDEKD